MTVRGFKVLGAAASTPVGGDIEETLSSVRLGVQRVQVTGVVGASGARMRAACVFPVSHDRGGLPRQRALLEGPISDVGPAVGVEPVHLIVCADQWSPLGTELGLFSGWGEKYEAFRALAGGVSSEAAASLAERGVHIERTTTALGGHTAAIAALADDGISGRVLLLASTTLADPFGLELVAMAMASGALPAEFIPGEVGVALLLETVDVAEADLLVAQPSRLGRDDAVADAANIVLDAAPAAASALVELWPDVNGERWRAKALSFAALRAWGRLGGTPVRRDAAQSVGDVGAAAAALQIALAWTALGAAPSASLVTAQDRDGAAGVALVRRRIS